jgi:hypothetical protein
MRTISGLSHDLSPLGIGRVVIRDVIIPGSIRVEHIVTETLITIRCGRCGHEFDDARAECRTSRCKRCNRVCRLDQAAEVGGNVISIRRHDRARSTKETENGIC